MRLNGYRNLKNLDISARIKKIKTILNNMTKAYKEKDDIYTTIKYYN